MSTKQLPSAELNFRKCVDVVKIALQTFNALRAIPSNGTVASPLRAAINDLVNAGVSIPPFFPPPISHIFALRPLLIVIWLMSAIPYSRNWPPLSTSPSTNLSESFLTLSVLPLHICLPDSPHAQLTLALLLLKEVIPSELFLSFNFHPLRCPIHSGSHRSFWPSY